MPYLEAQQFVMARPLFRAFDAYHLCVMAVLAGAAPGKVWVDDVAAPRVGFISGAEGCYLAGDPTYRPAYAELRGVIPHFAYLICEPAEWEAVLVGATPGEVWTNAAALRHERQHYVLRPADTPGWQLMDWRSRVKEGMRVAPVDAALIAQDSLVNHEDVMEWVDGWHSREDFLEHGLGSCVIVDHTIAAWSLTDCALGSRCEIGIMTDAAFRRRGLGSLAVAATIEACLARGLREIGWQCLRSNAGSVAIARRMGFQLERDYLAFSAWLPAENPGDVRPAEFEEWARHYERADKVQPGWNFLAAQAWASAGRVEQALACLWRLQETGWKGQRGWFEDSWHLDSIRSLPEYTALEAALVEEG